MILASAPSRRNGPRSSFRCSSARNRAGTQDPYRRRHDVPHHHGNRSAADEADPRQGDAHQADAAPPDPGEAHASLRSVPPAQPLTAPHGPIAVAERVDPPNPDVDAYVEQAERWPDEITALRPILTASGLAEQIKWAKPCYSHDGGNILILQEMKEFLAVMFFKGALLTDPKNVLEDQGPNSRSARRMCITSVDDVTRLADTIGAYVAEAIEIERSGSQVPPAPALELVDELRLRLDADPALRTAFEALTPGRQREYNLYVEEAKQASTRSARVEKHVQRILDGRGLRDR